MESSYHLDHVMFFNVCLILTLRTTHRISLLYDTVNLLFKLENMH